MNYHWPESLKTFSRKIIKNYDRHSHWQLTPAMIKTEWLGFPGASEPQIRATETRVGIQLPPSYRSFLQVSNGWPQSDWTELQLWSTEEIDWFSCRNQDWIEAWHLYDNGLPSIPDEIYFVYGEAQDCVNLRREYLSTALEISSNSGDGDIFLLIPDVVFEDGEWEAWHFGNKLPGAMRYRSFYDLMQQVIAQGCFIL